MNANQSISLFAFDYFARKEPLSYPVLFFFHLFEFLLHVFITFLLQVLLYCVCVEVYREEKRKKRNAWRKMNVTASKASLVLLCSIQHSNYISPYVESAAWTDRTKLFRWLLAMKQATSIHLYCVLSSYCSHPIKFVVRDTVKKTHPTCTFTVGLQPTTGQCEGREEKRTSK